MPFSCFGIQIHVPSEHDLVVGGAGGQLPVPAELPAPGHPYHARHLHHWLRLQRATQVL